MTFNGHSYARSQALLTRTIGRDYAPSSYTLSSVAERYQIIYLWKVLEGLVPNVNNKITSTLHVRLGRKCVVPRVPNGKLGKIREASLAVHGAKLLNVLPKPLRNMSGVKLDT